MYVYLVLANRLGGLNLLIRNSVVRLTDSPDMTIAVYHQHKVTKQQVALYHSHNDMLSFRVLALAGTV